MNKFLENINIHESWNNFLTKEIKTELDNIYKNIEKETFYPDTKNVLRFLELDLTKIKYIIVGMEPYPSSYKKENKIIPEATGRSFEVSSILDKEWEDKFKQSSLRNILKTIYFNETGNKENLENIRKKIRNKEFKIKKPKDWFNSLESQGILFLNATLTVRAGKVDTHQKLWENFMNSLINFIEENNHNIKYLLWGTKAKERFSKIISEDKYIYSCHPRLPEFVEQNCFKKIQNINWLG